MPNWPRSHFKSDARAALPRRCYPEGFPRCGPGQMGDGQQNPSHPQEKGTGSGPSRRPLLPHKEGGGYQETHGEAQEGELFKSLVTPL